MLFRLSMLCKVSFAPTPQVDHGTIYVRVTGAGEHENWDAAGGNIECAFPHPCHDLHGTDVQCYCRAASHEIKRVDWKKEPAGHIKRTITVEVVGGEPGDLLTWYPIGTKRVSKRW